MLPVVAETYDGSLNDINGFHVRPEHVYTALDNAVSGAVEEAIINAMVAAETMVGRDVNRSEALEHERMREILQRYTGYNK